MQYKITRSSLSEDELAHYGVLGMKWGRRKSRPSSGRKRTSSSKKTSAKKSSSKKSLKDKAKETIAKVDKQKVKQIAKTSALIAGKIAAVSLLGYAGATAINEINNLKSENAGLSSQLKDAKRDYSNVAFKYVMSSDRAKSNEKMLEVMVEAIQKANSASIANPNYRLEQLNKMADQAQEYLDIIQKK